MAELLSEDAVPAAPTARGKKYVHGKDGWLFLDKDSNQVMLQHQGEHPFSRQELVSWQRLLETRTDWLARRDTPYWFVVAADAHAVYPEMLPDGLISSRERPVMQLLDHLAGAGSHAEVIYPFEELLDAKARHPVFSQLDSRWNGYGAYIAYRSIIDRIKPFVELREVTEDDLELTEKLVKGDLGSKLDPPQEARQLIGTVRDSPAKILFDNRVANNGRVVITECADAPDTSILLFADCYTYKNLPYFAHSFRRVCLAHTWKMDFEVVEQEKPDLVLTQQTERLIRKIPFDLPIISVKQLADQKRELGRVRHRPLPYLPTVEDQDRHAPAYA